MIRHKTNIILAILSLILVFLLSQKVLAASFAISGIENTTQELGSAETGVIMRGATLNSDIKINGTLANLANNGNISITNNNIVDLYPAISEEGSSNAIFNLGQISVLGSLANSFGILSNGENATIKNSGLISVEGKNGSGISFDGENATITNSGFIAVEGDDNLWGILSNGQNPTIANSGLISVKDKGAGENSGGILSAKNNSTGTLITNSGIILVEAKNGRGISSSGANSSIANSGFISVKDQSTDTDSGGIFSVSQDSLNSTITNSGTIFVEAKNGRGISSTGTNSSITNSGLIFANGESALGVVTYGSNSKITNSGLVSLKGDKGRAISSGSNTINTTIINSGNIEISGNESRGVSFVGPNETNAEPGVNLLFNSGTIIAKGEGSLAIHGNVGKESVILGKGSEIIGAIDLGDGNDSILASGNGISTRLATKNVESLSIEAGVAGVVDGSNLHTIDPTGAASLTLGVSSLVSSIKNSIDSYKSQASISESSDGATKSPIWLNIFNSSFNRGDDSKNLAYRNQTLGIIGGYNLSSNNSRGLIFGASSGNIKTKSSSFKTDVGSFFIGTYQKIDLTTATSLDFDLIAGYEKYSNERIVVDNINGYQAARSNFNNFFISPTITLGHKFKITEIFELKPIAKASYTSSSFGDSKETGNSESNFKTKGRNVHIFNSKIGVDALLNLNKIKFELGAGISTRIIKEGEVKSSINNSEFSYSTNNNKNVNGHYLRVAAYIIDLKNFSLTANYERRKASGGESGSFGQIGANYKF